MNSNTEGFFRLERHPNHHYITRDPVPQDFKDSVPGSLSDFHIVLTMPREKVLEGHEVHLHDVLGTEVVVTKSAGQARHFHGEDGGEAEAKAFMAEHDLCNCWDFSWLPN
jgi:hypothetical protein